MIKNIYYWIMLLVLNSCDMEKGFTISCQITGIGDSTQVMLLNLATEEYLDSAMVIDESFVFSGKLLEVPEELRVVSSLKEMKKGNLFYTDLLMGNEVVTVSGDISDLPLNVTTTGSDAQNEAQAYHRQLYAWNKKIDRINHHLEMLESQKDSVKISQEKKQLLRTKDSLANWQIQFIKDNFNSYIGLLLYNYRRDFEVDTLKKLYDGVSEELKQSRFGRSIAMQISHPAPKVGDPFHDFVAIDQNGDSTSLSAFSDHFILLQFAGTGCYWSGLSNQEMKGIYQQFKDSVALVSYYVDSHQQTWQTTTKQDSILWTSLWQEGGKYSEPHQKYGITGTPTFYIISPENKVVDKWFGYENGMIERKLKEALNTKGEKVDR